MNNSDAQKIPENIFKKIVDSTLYPILFANSEGIILYRNNSAAKVFGLGDNRNLSTLFSIELGNLKKTILAQNEYKMLLSDQTITIKGVFAEKDLLGFVVSSGSLREVDLEKKKIEFISLASHQLRTPLGSMRWSLEMLLADEFGKLPKSIKKIITQIYRSDLRMINLVNDLLSVSRIDQGRVFDEPKLTDITELIKDAATEIQVEAQKKGITGELHFGNEKIPSVVIDPTRFREVIHNLLTNAIKYNKDKGVIKVFVSKEPDYVKISVQDTGIGIAHNDLIKISSKYFRAENALAKTNEGTGLGLYIVKSYVESWGGKLKVVSEVNKGTTVEIFLPITVK